MQAGIIRREEAGLAGKTLGLNLAAVVRQDARSNGAAIALGPFQAHFNPMIACGRIVSQQRRRFVAVHHQNIDVAIIIEVAERSPATGMARGNAWACLIAEFHEGSVTLISPNQAW